MNAKNSVSGKHGLIKLPTIQLGCQKARAKLLVMFTALKRVAVGWFSFAIRTFVAVLLLCAAGSGFAATTVNSTTLDGNVYSSASPYYVAPGQVISAALNVTYSGNGNWKSSGMQFGTVLGAWTVGINCTDTNIGVNPAFAGAAGDYVHTLSITVPSTPTGTMNAYFNTYNNSACGGNGGSVVWTNAIVVVSSPPTATTNPAGSVTVTGATLNGTVSSNGGPTTVTFDYGLTTSYGSSITAVQSPLAAVASNAAVSAGLTGLTCNTTYHYRVRAVNVVGPSLGTDATFTTLLCAPTVAKSFSPSTIVSSTTSTLTITLTNPNATAITGAAFTDNYPAGLVNTASASGTTTCGGTVTAINGGSSLALSGGTIPASGSCKATVNVTSATAGSYVNSTGSVTSTNAGSGTAVSATLTVNAVVVVSSFNSFESATPAGAITGVIWTKVAGTPFSLSVVAISGGSQAVSFNGNVKIELIANDGTSCLTSPSVIQTIAATAISGGRSTVSFAAVADAWRDVRVRISSLATSPTVIACSTDNFAIRPNSLSVINTDTDWQTAGTVRTLNNIVASGGVVHKAGQPFTISASAKNSAGVITGNYAGSPSAQPIACTLPAPTCINGILTPGAWTAAGGTVTSTTASYSEAGSFNLTLQDTTFASVDAGDGTPATCAGYYVCSAAISVGRFVPDHFVVTASNVPQLKTFDNAACAVRSFTYIGQPFGYVTAPQVLVTAQNAANATTANYTGNLWKLATAAGVQDCTTNPDICTLTSGSVTQTYTYTATPAATPNWDNAQVVMSTPTIVAGTNGTGTVTSASTDLLAFKRSLTAPQALFTAGIALADSVTDTSESGNCGVANCNITTLAAAAFNPIAFDSGNEFRYGRLKLANALGSELLNLPIPIQTQYWNGSAFVTNTADNCTALATNNIKLTAPPAGVSATVGAFASGLGSLNLSPPTAAAKVAVNLCVDLGADPAGGTVCTATSANLPYLQGLWAPGSSYNNDPGALATFGVYKGANEFIYLRENY